MSVLRGDAVVEDLESGTPQVTGKIDKVTVDVK
jgi:hypothetical protein